MKRIVWQFLFALSVTMNLSLIFIWGYHRFSHPSAKQKAFRQWQSCCILSGIKLTAQQRRQLRQLRHKMMERRFRYIQHSQHFRRVIAEALSAAQPDKKAIEQQIKANAKLRLQFQLWVAHHFLAIRQLLTPSQEKRFRKVLRIHLLNHDHKGRHACSVNIH